MILLLSVARHKSRCVGRLKLPSLLAVDIPHQGSIFIHFVEKFIFTGVGGCIIAWASWFVDYERRNSSAPICMNTQQLAHEQHRQCKRSYSTRAASSVCVGGDGCRVWYKWIQIWESEKAFLTLFDSMQQVWQKMWDSITNPCCCTVRACPRLQSDTKQSWHAWKRVHGSNIIISTV